MIFCLTTDDDINRRNPVFGTTDYAYMMDQRCLHIQIYLELQRAGLKKHDLLVQAAQAVALVDVRFAIERLRVLRKTKAA